MKGNLFRAAVLSCVILAGPAESESRFIVRNDSGLPAMQATCVMAGCNVVRGLDGSLGQLFLVTTADSTNPNLFLPLLLSQPGVSNVELDVLNVFSGPPASSTVPSVLWDSAPVSYFGTNVWHGFLNQPAAQIIRLADTQTTFNVSGSGIVAVIDTGVDPNHPVLKNVLVPGYDFTRNQDGMADEKGDVNQSTAAVVDGAQPVMVNQSTAAVVDQSTAAVVDNPQYAAFGHGTMTAGIIHLVAPKAFIMPLKAFRADGTGYLSDILRAIHRGVQNNAKILSMSFSMSSYSRELERAVNYANGNGVICVASVGNDGQNVLVYPAAFAGRVMGVASTNNNDQRSTFSNYGQGLVWVAAPGEGIMTTYPWGTYAAGSGTSFSAPFVAGTAALLLDIQSSLSPSQAAQAVAHAKWISPDLGNGRLDTYQAVLAQRNAARVW
jgi:subtilisin family serine protease